MRRSGTSLEVLVYLELPSLIGLFIESRLRELCKIATVCEFRKIEFFGESLEVLEVLADDYPGQIPPTRHDRPSTFGLPLSVCRSVPR